MYSTRSVLLCTYKGIFINCVSFFRTLFLNWAEHVHLKVEIGFFNGFDLHEQVFYSLCADYGRNGVWIKIGGFFYFFFLNYIFFLYLTKRERNSLCIDPTLFYRSFFFIIFYYMFLILLKNLYFYYLGI